jgi:glycine hydroxymethyltransferase
MRLGTPAVTSRGFGGEEMKAISRFIVKIISHIDDPTIEKEVHDEVQGICSRFLVPGVDA